MPGPIPARVIVEAQWGDEGKGKSTDVEAAVSEAGGSLARIGDVTPADGGVVLVRSGGEEALEDRGYEHFVREST